MGDFLYICCMEKEFVPYEEALELKALGFDEPCFGYYLEDGMFIDTKIRKQMGNAISAPTWQSAFKWFRENYGLEGISQRAEDKVWYKFSIYLYLEDGKRIRYGGYEYLTSEEAELECLKKLIEIVKEK
jgi:hypothetical protein